MFFFSLWGYRGNGTQSCWPGIFIVGEMNIFEHGEARAIGRIPMIYQTCFSIVLSLKTSLLECQKIQDR